MPAIESPTAGLAALCFLRPEAQAWRRQWHEGRSLRAQLCAGLRAVQLAPAAFGCRTGRARWRRRAVIPLGRRAVRGEGAVCLRGAGAGLAAAVCLGRERRLPLRARRLPWQVEAGGRGHRRRESRQPRRRQHRQPRWRREARGGRGPRRCAAAAAASSIVATGGAATACGSEDARSTTAAHGAASGCGASPARRAAAAGLCRNAAGLRSLDLACWHHPERGWSENVTVRWATSAGRVGFTSRRSS
mmetsp:Transcript_56774/g.176557  ORF Transcript_56774/g.176557 Transcript_56774/m.176557 type:complete len:246 (+) Transcript_56774:352-1089(+)